MHKARTSRTAAILLAIALTASVPVLTGCGIIQGVVEQATGGEVDLGGASVPDDFPAEVPLIDGDVVAGAGIGNADGKVWNVTVKVSGAEAFDEISAQLTDAGFEATEVGGENSGTFTKDPYGVLVVVTDSGAEGWVANYTVTQSSQ